MRDLGRVTFTGDVSLGYSRVFLPVFLFFDIFSFLLSLDLSKLRELVILFHLVHRSVCALVKFDDTDEAH